MLLKAQQHGDFDTLLVCEEMRAIYVYTLFTTLHKPAAENGAKCGEAAQASVIIFLTVGLLDLNTLKLNRKYSGLCRIR